MAEFDTRTNPETGKNTSSSSFLEVPLPTIPVKCYLCHTMSDTPNWSEPPRLGQYPTGQVPPGGWRPYGTAANLRLLADGYFGLSYVFLLNVAIVVGTIVARVSDPTNPVVFLAGVLVIFLAIGGSSYVYNRKIAMACNWPGYGAPLASFLMAVNSAVCFGIIGYVVIQTIAATEMNKYGVKGGILRGIRKKEVRMVIEQLQAFEAAPPTPTPPPQAPPPPSPPPPQMQL